MPIPYHRYFDLRTLPADGMALDSYAYLRQVTGSSIAEHPLVDAHTHLGRDRDGRALTLDELLADLAAYRVNGAVVFPFNDPDAGDDFRVPNERVYAACEAHPSTLIPFFRLNPNGPWQAEYDRCVRRGHVGIKLHPRAQRFTLGGTAVREVFERAAADGLPVLVHTGFGMPATADTVAELATELPTLRLILGHADFVDMPRAARTLQPFANVYFETSVVRMYDLFTVLRSVDPGRVIYGSDLPYAATSEALQAVSVMSRIAGVPVERLRDLFAGNLLRLLGPAVTARVAT